MDPRIVEGGVTAAMVAEQVAVERDIVALLDRARRYAAALEEERESVEDGSERAAAIDSVLDQLVTEEGTYRQPMLIDQVKYLFNMIKDADQAPGQEATDRLAVLKAAFA